MLYRSSIDDSQTQTSTLDDGRIIEVYEEADMTKQCQSCGMPLYTKRVGDCRGTEKDGSKSEKWCSLCYKNGTFIGPDCTLDEMKKIVDDAHANKAAVSSCAGSHKNNSPISSAGSKSRKIS